MSVVSSVPGPVCKRWLKIIRKSYPTALFYFTQSENDLVVIYYVGAGETIQAVYGELCVDGIQGASDVPETLFRSHFQLQQTSSQLYQLSGIQEVCLWERKGSCLYQDQEMLLNVHGTVDPKTSKIRLFVCSIHRRSQKYETRELTGTQAVADCIQSLRTWYLLYKAARNVKRILGT